MLCQRMASDTDLWMSVNKAAQEKYQSSLDAKGSLISKSFELMPQNVLCRFKFFEPSQKFDCI